MLVRLNLPWFFFHAGSQSAYQDTEFSSLHLTDEEEFNEDMYNSGEEDDLLRDENDFSDDEGDTDDEDNIPINFRNALILNEV